MAGNLAQLKGSHPGVKIAIGTGMLHQIHGLKP
jgi:hypothetical protein